METQKIYFDDTYAHYAQAGAGASSVVVLHGWGASLKHWEWLLPVLAEAGYTAYALDLLGHGEAPRLGRDYAVERYYTYLCRWIATLNIQTPVLLGHSMGGYLGLQYALDHPGAVRGLILVDPVYTHQQFHSYYQFIWRLLSGLDMRTWGEILLRRIPAWLIEAVDYLNRYGISDAPASLRRQVALDYKRADPLIVQTLLTVGDLRPRLDQLVAPVLLTWGCQDQVLPPDSFEALAGLLSAPSLHCFTDTGHNPHLTRAWNFAELILAFLEHLEEPGAQPEVAGRSHCTI